MDELRISPKDLAKAMDVDHYTVYKWLREEAISVENLCKLAEQLKTTPGYLLSGTVEGLPPAVVTDAVIAIRVAIEREGLSLTPGDEAKLIVALATDAARISMTRRDLSQQAIRFIDFARGFGGKDNPGNQFRRLADGIA